MSNVTQLKRIQIGYSQDSKQVAVVAGDRTYSWPAGAVPGRRQALRAWAEGEKQPDDCNGMVYAKGTKVCLTDAPGGWAYVMPPREATRVAQGLEKTLRNMRDPNAPPF